MKMISEKAIKLIVATEHEAFAENQAMYGIDGIIQQVAIQILFANGLLNIDAWEEATKMAKDKLVKMGEKVEKQNAYS